LSDIVVTHSPRYKINMELDDGETIFDKLEVGYDELRNSENSIGIVKDYYRRYLKEGEKLWWIDSEPLEEQSVTPYVKLWNTLERAEKKELQIKGFCWFPEIFSNKSRSEEHTSELQSRFDLVCRLLLEKKKKII